MLAYIKYAQNNNCNLSLKNSSFFSIYHKNINKSTYFKNNNSVKGFYKDPIIDDFIYFASNGLKKNAVFRKNEIQVESSLNNFVSYFHNIEDSLLIFNIYPQKYNNDLVNNENKIQNLLNHNYKAFQKTKTINTFFSQNLKELNSNDGNNFLIKSYFDKFYFLSNNGFIKQVNSNSFQKSLFSGLLYVLPLKVQNIFKDLILISHLLLKFYININFKKANIPTLIVNMQLYILFFKFLAFKLNNFLSLNKIKIRKSNWLLFKYVQLYLPQLNNTLNLFSVLFNNQINNLLKTKFNSLIWENNTPYIFSKYNYNFNELNKLSFNSKLNFLRLIFLKLTNELNLDQINSIENVKLTTKYLKIKLLVNKFYLLNCFTKPIFNDRFTNHLNILKHSLNVYTSTNNSLTSLNNNLLEISNSENFSKGEYHLRRNFLDLIKTKEIIRFNKDDKLKSITNYSKINNVKEIKLLKKEINSFKRTFVKKKKNKKIFKKTNKSFTLASKNYKIAKLKRIKQPWLRVFNKLNLTNFVN